MRPGEGLFKLLQLEAGKSRSVATLLSLRCKVVGLRLTLGAGRRRSRVGALFLRPYLLGRDAHLSGLRCRRRRR